MPFREPASDSPQGMQQLQQFIMRGMAGREKRKLTVAEARPILEDMEADRLISTEDITKEAIKSVLFCSVFFCRLQGTHFVCRSRSKKMVLCFWMKSIRLQTLAT
jgi:hypothetical protein